ncbi:MAG: DUF4231 domain-containing protein [Acidobacteria bacterium]|nr:DUF4231 domain-containing protein [Acidobacteriota bacterium]
MDKNTFEQYVKERYEGQIRWFQAKAAANKRWYQIFQWTVIVLASIVPVLVTAAPSSLENKYSMIWWITVVSSVLLAVGTAGVKTFKFQENWITYRATSERLVQEKFYYDGGVGEYGEADDRESLFVKRVESLLSGESSQWVSNQNSQV